MTNDTARQVEFYMSKYGETRREAYRRLERERYEAENAWKNRRAERTADTEEASDA